MLEEETEKLTKELNQNKALLTEERSRSENELEKLKQTYETKCNQLNDEKNHLKKEVDQIKDDKRNFEIEIEKHESIKNDLLCKISKLSNDFSKTKEIYDGKIQEYEKRLKKLNDLKKKINDLKSTKYQVKSLKDQLEDSKKLINELNEQIEKINNEKGKIYLKLTDQLNEIGKKIINQNKSIQNLYNKKTHDQKELDLYKDNIYKLIDEKNEIQGELNTILHINPENDYLKVKDINQDNEDLINLLKAEISNLKIKVIQLKNQKDMDSRYNKKYLIAIISIFFYKIKIAKKEKEILQKQLKYVKNTIERNSNNQQKIEIKRPFSKLKKVIYCIIFINRTKNNVKKWKFIKNLSPMLFNNYILSYKYINNHLNNIISYHNRIQSNKNIIDNTDISNLSSVLNSRDNAFNSEISNSPSTPSKLDDILLNKNNKNRYGNTKLKSIDEKTNKNKLNNNNNINNNKNKIIIEIKNKNEDVNNNNDNNDNDSNSNNSNNNNDNNDNYDSHDNNNSNTSNNSNSSDSSNDRNDNNINISIHNDIIDGNDLMKLSINPQNFKSNINQRNELLNFDLLESSESDLNSNGKSDLPLLSSNSENQNTNKSDHIFDLLSSIHKNLNKIKEDNDNEHQLILKNVSEIDHNRLLSQNNDHDTITSIPSIESSFDLETVKFDNAINDNQSTKSDSMSKNNFNIKSKSKKKTSHKKLHTSSNKNKVIPKKENTSSQSDGNITPKPIKTKIESEHHKKHHNKKSSNDITDLNSYNLSEPISNPDISLSFNENFVSTSISSSFNSNISFENTNISSSQLNISSSKNINKENIDKNYESNSLIFREESNSNLNIDTTKSSTSNDNLSQLDEQNNSITDRNLHSSSDIYSFEDESLNLTKTSNNITNTENSKKVNFLTFDSESVSILIDLHQDEANMNNADSHKSNERDINLSNASTSISSFL
ncbi:hypothetical protein U3516DRAFT_777207 [Neocallimastix sp. 'constans']